MDTFHTFWKDAPKNVFALCDSHKHWTSLNDHPFLPKDVTHTLGTHINNKTSATDRLLYFFCLDIYRDQTKFYYEKDTDNHIQQNLADAFKKAVEAFIGHWTDTSLQQTLLTAAIHLAVSAAPIALLALYLGHKTFTEWANLTKDNFEPHTPTPSKNIFAVMHITKVATHHWRKVSISSAHLMNILTQIIPLLVSPITNIYFIFKSPLDQNTCFFIPTHPAWTAKHKPGVIFQTVVEGKRSVFLQNNRITTDLIYTGNTAGHTISSFIYTIGTSFQSEDPILFFRARVGPPLHTAKIKTFGPENGYSIPCNSHEIVSYDAKTKTELVSTRPFPDIIMSARDSRIMLTPLSDQTLVIKVLSESGTPPSLSIQNACPDSISSTRPTHTRTGAIFAPKYSDGDKTIHKPIMHPLIHIFDQPELDTKGKTVKPFLPLDLCEMAVNKSILIIHMQFALSTYHNIISSISHLGYIKSPPKGCVLLPYVIWAIDALDLNPHNVFNGTPDSSYQDNVEKFFEKIRDEAILPTYKALVDPTRAPLHYLPNVPAAFVTYLLPNKDATLDLCNDRNKAHPELKFKLYENHIPVQNPALNDEPSRFFFSFGRGNPSLTTLNKALLDAFTEHVMVLFDYVLLEDLIWIYIIARHTSKEDLLSPPMLLREYCNSQMPSDRDPDLRALNLLFPI